MRVAFARRGGAQVAAWDESKRLSKRVDELRKRLAGKQEEVTAARTEAEKKGAQVGEWVSTWVGRRVVGFSGRKVRWGRTSHRWGTTSYRGEEAGVPEDRWGTASHV